MSSAWKATLTICYGLPFAFAVVFIFHGGATPVQIGGVLVQTAWAVFLEWWGRRS